MSNIRGACQRITGVGFTGTYKCAIAIEQVTLHCSAPLTKIICFHVVTLDLFRVGIEYGVTVES